MNVNDTSISTFSSSNKAAIWFSALLHTARPIGIRTYILIMNIQICRETAPFPPDGSINLFNLGRVSSTRSIQSSKFIVCSVGNLFLFSFPTELPLGVAKLPPTSLSRL